jgi:hypothetical protein
MSFAASHYQQIIHANHSIQFKDSKLELNLDHVPAHVHPNHDVLGPIPHNSPLSSTKCSTTHMMHSSGGLRYEEASGAAWEGGRGAAVGAAKVFPNAEAEKDQG